MANTSNSRKRDAPPGESPTSSPKAAEEKPKPLPLWFQGIREDDDEKIKEGVKLEIEAIFSKHGLENYYPLFLVDERDPITSFHSDRLYAAATSLKDDPKDILLVVSSNGGSIEPAYLISKALKRLSKSKFVAVVPRRAKSAATLLALGADEIHMGIMSELGPIDPQISGLPALALGNALDVIADLTCRFPASSTMFGEYISSQVPIRTLGYFQRVSESAAQYAERLLLNKELEGDRKASVIADRLVNHYKDHSFVIDANESRELLGESIVKEGTTEYAAADEVYKFLEFVEMIIDKNKYYYLVGACNQFAISTKKSS